MPAASDDLVVLEASSTIENGSWIKNGHRKGFSLVVTGMAGGDVLKVFVSNMPQSLASSASIRGAQVGSDVTANGTVVFTSQFGWVQIQHTTSGSGVVYVDLHGFN